MKQPTDGAKKPHKPPEYLKENQLFMLRKQLMRMISNSQAIDLVQSRAWNGLINWSYHLPAEVDTGNDSI